MCLLVVFFRLLLKWVIKKKNLEQVTIKILDISLLYILWLPCGCHCLASIELVYLPCALSSAEAFVFKKLRQRERRKNGKGGKTAREREKGRKPLPDFCRNMAPARGVVVHCDACMLGCGTKNFKTGVLKF